MSVDDTDNEIRVGFVLQPNIDHNEVACIGEKEDDDDGGDGFGSSPRLNNSERTNTSTSTNSTLMFSASSLPSLEGIDNLTTHEDGSRPSYSSLSPHDHGDSNGNQGGGGGDDDTSLPAFTADATNNHNSPHDHRPLLASDSSTTTAAAAAYFRPPKSTVLATTATTRPLPASPRLPTTTTTSTTRSTLQPAPNPFVVAVRQHQVGGTKRTAAAASVGSSHASLVDDGLTTTTPTDATQRKRVRRVGRVGDGAGINNNNNAVNSTSNHPNNTQATYSATENAAANVSPAGASVSTTTTEASAAKTDIDNNPIPPHLRHLCQSKHDEKWFEMFQQLKFYQQMHGDTLVPQHYDPNPRLGRWVHYQRVEYWIFQQRGKAKISTDRIQRLESIGFAWDPQKVQWQAMFKRLEEFVQEHGHAKVPKGYQGDPELANWVRNQRLEQANFEKAKRSRMTPERYAMLNKLGFAWSQPASTKRRSNKPKGSAEVSSSLARLDPLPLDDDI